MARMHIREIRPNMNIVTLELVRTALLAIILGVMIGAGRMRIDVAGRGWRTILLALILVLLTSAGQVAETLRYADDVTWNRTTTTGMAVFAGYLLGFMLVGTELVRSIATAMAENRTRRMATAVTKLKTQLNSGQDLLRGVLKGSLSGVVVARAIRDESGAIVELGCELMNSAAGQIFGRSNETLLGRSLVREVPNFDSEGLLRECISVIESGLPFNQERRYTFSGSAEWLHTVVVKLGDGCAMTFTNITARKIAEEQLRHAALHDVLTGLPNRAMFIERLEQALYWAQRHHHYGFAVMFFDFDRFKSVNDNLGHEVGDALLVSISGRLREQLGFDSSKSDTGHLPARLGGDEFVVLLDGIQHSTEAVRIAQQLQSVLNAPHYLNGFEVVSTASIGIVTCDGRYERADHILRDADLAMYEAKRSGRSRHVVFDPSMRQPDVDQRAA